MAREKEEVAKPKGSRAGGKLQYRAPALEKGLDILELLSNERVPLTLSAICSRLGRSQGEIFRMVQVLQSRDFIDQAPGSDGYVPTDRLFSIAMRQPVTQSLLEIAIPIMRTLAAKVGQSCHLALFTRGDVVVVARMESGDQIGFSVRIGYRREMTKTVSGLVLFAFQPRDIQERWLEMARGQVDDEGMAAFVAAAEKVKKSGHGNAASTFVSGVTDLSVPIIRGDRATAALTVPFIKTLHSDYTVKQVIAHLQEAANQISGRLVDSDSRV